MIAGWYERSDRGKVVESMGGVEVTDQDLTLRMAAGDVKALETLYDRHGRRAYSVAYKVLGDEGRAEDAVQEAFIRVWNHAGQFDATKGTFMTWLLTLARNRAIDQLRGKAGRSGQELGLSLEIEATARESDPASEALRRLDQEVVRRGVMALPALQRQAVELAYFSGYSGPEIAEMVRVPLSTVKGRLRLGLEKMHSYLAGWQAQAAA